MIITYCGRLDHLFYWATFMLLICNFKELKSNMERKKHYQVHSSTARTSPKSWQICNYNYFLFLRTLKDSMKLKMKFWLKDCDIQKYHYSMSSDVNKCYQAPKANRIVCWQNVKSSANNITPDQEWLKVIIQVPGYNHVLTGSRSHVPLLHMFIIKDSCQ